jgi:ABC-type transport system involved in multi-copper enzyme maturation permease subunit
MTAVAPYRSGSRAGSDGFPQLLHAEWTKFRTVHGWVIGLIVAVVVTAGLGIFAAVASNNSSCTSSVSGPSSGGGPSSGSSTVQHGAACTSPLTLGPGGEPVMDEFYFVRQPLAGNGSITVRVTSLTGQPVEGQGPGSPPAPRDLEPWSKAGIIIKDDTTQGSAYAAMMITGSNGVRMQWNYTGDTAGLSGTVSAASPRWLRLTRAGGTITGYDSADGVHWTQVGAVNLAGLPSTVQAGMFATSPRHSVISTSFGGGSGFNNATQDTAVFDHVSRIGAWPSDTWTGDYVGEAAAAAATGQVAGGYHQVAGRFAVNGSGDIAPVMDGALNSGDGYPTITIFLIGTFAGLIAVIVVATMFMTAEYRRGLIRTTLAASPRRDRVLAAKAIVLGIAAFVAGLAGAAGAVLFGTTLVHRQGNSVFPVPGLTELRVIVGTALLVAVAAVLTLAVATMLRRSAAAITVVIVAIVLPYFLAFTNAVPAGVGDWLLRITPAAAFALQQPMPQYHQVVANYRPIGGFFPLAPWAGLAVLCLWTAIALAAAGFLLRRRDV